MTGDTTRETGRSSSTIDFVNGLVHSFSESDSEGGDGTDTANFIEDLMRLTDVDSDSESDTVDFIQDLMMNLK